MVNEIAFLAAGQSWGTNCQAARVRRLRLDTRKATHVALQSTIAERPSLDFLRTGDALITAGAAFWLGIDRLHSIHDHFMWTVGRHSQRNRELLKFGAQLLLMCLYCLLALIERALLSDLSDTGEPRDEREQHANRQVWPQQPLGEEDT
jgi:hypothetical protein